MTEYKLQPQRRFPIFPDTSRSANWFVGPDSYPRRSYFGDQFNSLQKEEQFSNFIANTTFPEAVGLNLTVKYLLDNESSGTYFYMGHALDIVTKKPISVAEHDAIALIYKQYSLSHPLFITDGGFFLLDTDSNGVHFGMELSLNGKTANSPKMIGNGGIKSIGSYIVPFATVGDHAISLGISYDPEF
jgi:hypothetical protein